MPQATPSSRSNPVLHTTGAVASLLTISLVVFVYWRGLLPLYGSGPTNAFLHKMVIVIIFIAIFLPVRLPAALRWSLPAFGLSLAPNATYTVAKISARRGDPILGPAVTHLFVLTPLVCSLILAFFPFAQSSVCLNMTSGIYYLFSRLTIALCCISAVSLSYTVWSRISLLNSVSESQIFLFLAGAMWSLQILKGAPPFHLALGSSSRLHERRRLILLACFLPFWWSAHDYLSSPVLPHPLKVPYEHPSAPLRILSSVQSTTGLIVVGEALPSPETGALPPFRYLRASHSLLGGVWMGERVQTTDGQEPLKDSFGVALGDSVYGTFVLQEAVRLVNSTERGRIGLVENALIIGLGIGTSATAFIRHGISTTIVEIDQAVFEAATMYFGLPVPRVEQVFLQDARKWVANQRLNPDTKTLYDIVVHDCFSGGGVPEHIFTLEFWEDLKFIMQPEGILVVNFAGMPQSDSTLMVLSTLEKSFEQCRAFHDLSEPLQEDKYDSEFMNIVFFCTNSLSKLTFREPLTEDYLGSYLRRYMLDSLQLRELELHLIRGTKHVVDDHGYLLTDAHNPLGKLQAEQGEHHWKLMRQVLPDVHWETY